MRWSLLMRERMGRRSRTAPGRKFRTVKISRSQISPRSRAARAWKRKESPSFRAETALRRDSKRSAASSARAAKTFSLFSKSSRAFSGEKRMTAAHSTTQRGRDGRKISGRRGTKLERGGEEEREELSGRAARKRKKSS